MPPPLTQVSHNQTLIDYIPNLRSKAASGKYTILETRHLPLGVFSFTDKGQPYWLIWQYPLILWSRVLPFDLNCCRKQYCLWNWGSRAKKPLRSGKNRARAFSACFEYACCEPPLLLLDPFSLHWQSTWPGRRAGELCKNNGYILEISRQANSLPFNFSRKWRNCKKGMNVLTKGTCKLQKKRKHQFEISFRINFWDYVALDGQEKGRGWESFGGKWAR